MMEEVDRYYQGNITLEEAENYIASGMMTAVRAFVANGYYLRRIRDEKLYKESGYKNFKEYLEDRYKKDEGWASKCIKVNQQLSVGGNSPILDSKYCDYNDKYKLVELASMTEEQRTQVSPDMSVKALREFRKSESENLVTSQENKVEESELEVMDAVQEVATLETPEPEPEKLSAYGTPIKVYPADSLIACPGCEGGHDCFMCHLQCGIRQEYCRCVEVTTGNPFPCEQIDRIDVLREEVGERCQFVNLDLAHHRTGDHEPVPCCKECSNPCQYACERSVQEREAEEQTCNTDPLSCLHRDDYSCTLTPDQKNTPGDGNQCERSCCWECKYHGMCETECDSSAGRDGKRPEFNAAWFVQQWVKHNPNSHKAVMRICREQISNSDRAKAVQKYIAPCGCSGLCDRTYRHDFHGFAGGMDFEIGRVKLHLKYGRFVVELLNLYDPSSPEYDKEPVKEIPDPEEPIIKPDIQHVYEDPVPDGSWKFGSLPQAKEKYIKNLARVLVEKKGKRLRYSILQGTLDDETVKWRLEDLADETDRAIEIGDDVIAYPCAEIIEFSRGDEDLGTCSYTRFGTQVRKAFEEWKERKDSQAAPVKPVDADPVIDVEFEEVSEPAKELKPERPYTLEEVEKEIERTEAIFLGVPEKDKQSVPYRRNVMRLDAMRLLYDNMKE